MNSRIVTLLLVTVVALVSTEIAGGKAPAPIQPQAVQLTVAPAAAPTPALKYQLLPELLDMTPGNAAVQYYRSFSWEWWTNLRKQPDYPKWLEHTTTPLKDLPRKELESVVSTHALLELDIAARKENCDWDMTSRVRSENFVMLLPDVQSFRELANVLALKARYQIAEGQYDKALYTLQTGMAMGRHISQMPSLICNLVGNAICNQMLNQVEELMQAPGAPNLYWALTTLPSPFIDLRKPIQGERVMIHGFFASLGDLESGRLTQEQEEKLEDRLISAMRGAFGETARVRDADRLELAILVMKLYPDSKKALIEGGRKAEEVESWPVLQVVLMASLREFRRLEDEFHKWLYLPFPEAQKGLDDAEAQIRAARARLDILPLFDLLPAVSKVAWAAERTERRIAALRCVEAVRLFAAAHDGQLPEALSAITEVPVPDDPVTGKSFDYTVEGRTFTLHGPPLVSLQSRVDAMLRYQVTLTH
jgi:hypothetical protein